jgi:hypothetical protein
MTIAAATAVAMKIVRFETRPRSTSRCRARAPSMSGDAAVDLCDPRFFPELFLERATTVTCHALIDHCGSNAKMRFQSFFMLITVQPFFFASS